MGYRTIKTHESMYKKLTVVAAMLTYDSAHDATYVVEDVYLDLGQDWMWTTICRRGYRECQVLSPRQWEDIDFAETLDELLRCVRNIQHGEYFGDRGDVE